MIGLFIISIFFYIASVSPSFHGGCNLNGLYLPNGTIWQADPCEQCQCLSSVAICDTLKCSSSNCPTDEGNSYQHQLVSLPHECCPKCLPRFQSCFENGQEILHGSTWDPSACVACQCYNGSVSCANKECHFNGCQDGQVVVHNSTNCCPTCHSTRKKCKSVNDILHNDGETWSPISCVRCQCMDGAEYCYLAQCPSLSCTLNHTLVSLPGDCCPTCQGNFCIDNNISYQSGQIWKRDSCRRCVCNAGVVSCHRKRCPNISCSREHIVSQPEGQCCPSCVPKHGHCTINETITAHGISYVSASVRCNETNKEYCSCSNGEIKCDSLVCQKGTCGNGKKLQRSLKLCECDKCVPDLDVCYADGISKNNGDTWRIGCDICECKKGKIKCFSPICPICVAGFLHHFQLENTNMPICCQPCRRAKCPQTCTSCTEDTTNMITNSASICTSCHRGLHLQEGSCVRECKEGYFSRPGICLPCHSSCSDCTDVTKFHCKRCIAPLVLQHNECLPKCQRAFFAREDRKCEPCHSSCKECSSSLPSDCLACSTGEILINNTCVQCPSKHSQIDAVCNEACHNKEDCLHCKTGFLQQNGLCVQNCTKGYYSNFSECLRCKKNCAECSSSKCTECNPPHALQNGTCVISCSNGLLRHQTENNCYYNEHIPILFITGSIIVPVGGLTQVNSSTVKLYDPDTSVNLLAFVLESAPFNGDLVLYKNIEIILSAGDKFAMNDLDDGLLFYRHKYYLPHNDVIKLSAYDGNFKSDINYLTINIVSIYPPVLNAVEPLIVRRGGKCVISEEFVRVSDVDSLDSVNFHILDGPLFGDVSVRGKRTKKFSLNDLQELVVVYECNFGSNQRTDKLVMQVNDGFNAVNFVIDIFIVDGEGPGPTLIRNKGLKVKMNKHVQITSNILQARIINEADVSNVLYMLKEQIKSKEGRVTIATELTSGRSDAFSDDWIQMDKTHILKPTLSFTQKDIDEGKIWYVHSSSGNISAKTNLISNEEKPMQDNITFSISDAKHTANVLKDQALLVEVDWDSVPEEGGSVEEEYGITVYEGQAVTLTKYHFPMSETKPVANTVYTITRPLGDNDGFLFHIESPGLQLRQFTQSDIVDSKLIYMPPFGVIEDEERHFSFKFTTSNALLDGEVETEEHKFNIDIKPSIQKQIYFIRPVVDIAMMSHSYATIDPTFFELSANDIKSVSIVLLQKPSHGMLFISRHGSESSPNIFTEETKMKLEDIRSSKLKYTHNGSPSATDSITFLAFTTNSEATLTINFKMRQNYSAKPKLPPKSSFFLQMKEGAVIIIPINVLQLTNTHSQDGSRRFYTLNSDPLLGSILLTEDDGITRSINTTQTLHEDDIANGKVTYVSDKEIGLTQKRETIIFNVKDQSNNALSNQILNIEIEPVNNIGPEMLIHRKVKVKEGGVTSLSENVISAIDPDTNEEDLRIMIITPPLFGYLYMKQRTKNEAHIIELPIREFNIEELQRGKVFYNQSRSRFQEPTVDSFHVQATDGVHVSAIGKIIIKIQLINDEAPLLLGEQVVLEVGQTVPIKNVSLLVSDMDTNPSDIHIQVHATPKHGTLLRKKTSNSTIKQSHILEQWSNFTFKAIQEETIFYSHDGSKNNTDEMEISITDGTFQTGGVVQFIILPSSLKIPYLNINKGITVTRTQSQVIRSSDLTAIDEDSVENSVKFIITMPTNAGTVQIYEEDSQQWRSLTVGSVFSQTDINERKIRYNQNNGGNSFDEIIFHVVDLDGNVLLDQQLNVTIIEEESSPITSIRQQITVYKRHSSALQLDYLTNNTNLEDIIVKVTKTPKFGQLQNTLEPGTVILSWKISELKRGNIIYVQNADGNISEDYFQISILHRKEAITRIDVDVRILSAPEKHISTNLIKARNGSRTFITNAHFNIHNNYPNNENVTIFIIKPTSYGTFEEMVNNQFDQVQQFLWNPLTNISYVHDGSTSFQDSFTVKIVEFGDEDYLLNGIIAKGPIKLDIEIFTKSNKEVSQINGGLDHLLYSKGKIHNIITASELLWTNDDYSHSNILYHLIKTPLLGNLKTLRNESEVVISFSQETINDGLLYYELTSPISSKTRDQFSFFVGTESLNLTKEETFNIEWSYFYMAERIYLVEASDNVAQVLVKRSGNNDKSDKVKCHTHSGPVSNRHTKSSKHKIIAGQKRDVVITFDAGEEQKYCNITLNSNTLSGEMEYISVRLTSENNSLIGKPRKSLIYLSDYRTKPTVSFKFNELYIKNFTGKVLLPVIRTGDLSKSFIVYCTTFTGVIHKSQLSQTDSIKNYSLSEIVFHPEASTAFCSVDLSSNVSGDKHSTVYVSLVTSSGKFQPGKYQRVVVSFEISKHHLVIRFKQSKYRTTERRGRIRIILQRNGKDLNQTSSVLISTREITSGSSPMAKAGEDFEPVSKKCIFEAGQTIIHVSIKIYDDWNNCSYEGSESFQVFISEPNNSLIAENSSTATIYISDDEDIPTLEFARSNSTALLSENSISAMVKRNGDINSNISVECLLMSNLGIVHTSAIIAKAKLHFSPQIRERECNIKNISTAYDDLFVILSQPFSKDITPILGPKRRLRVINLFESKDTSIFSFENSSYTFIAPVTEDEVVRIPLRRYGDLSNSAIIQVHSVSFSATNGQYYQIITDYAEFPPDNNSLNILIRIGKASRQPEETLSFKILLSSDDDAVQTGSISSVDIFIKTNPFRTFPFPPIIISMVGDIKETTNMAALEGYPLLCVSPCELTHPMYNYSSETCLDYGLQGQSNTIYSWQLFDPKEIRYTDITLNKSPNEQDSNLLNTSLFGVSSTIRCNVHFVPLGEEGFTYASHSKPVIMYNSSLLCPNNRHAGDSTNFTVKLEHLYDKSDNISRIKLRIKMRYYDGLIPLFSSKPIINLQQLLRNDQHSKYSDHPCSNLDLNSQIATLIQFTDQNSLRSSREFFNYPKDQHLSLFEHLDIYKCEWSFSYLYSVLEIASQCEASIKSEMQNEPAVQYKVTIELPLYLSYIGHLKSNEWKIYELNKTEVSLTYNDNSSKWKQLTYIEHPTVLLEVNRATLDKEGRLVIEFITKAKFGGQFIESYSNATYASSRILPPRNISLNFNLKILWSDHIWNELSQTWRARSDDRVDSDYNGIYTLELLPCIISNQKFYDHDSRPSCKPNSPMEFNISINMARLPTTARPALDAKFVLNNNKSFDAYANGTIHISEANKKMHPSQRLYGRVIWLPEKSWQSSLQLQIQKVYVCTAKNGYDPSGEVYGNGEESGCAQPSSKLSSHFLILDRSAELTHHEKINHNPSTEAHFIDSDFHFKNKAKILPKIDAFVFKADGLYHLNPADTWYIQVLYHIGHNFAIGKNTTLVSPPHFETTDIDDLLVNHSYYITGSNIQNISFITKEMQLKSSELASKYTIYISVSVVILVIIMLAVGFFVQRNYVVKKEDVIVRRLKNDQKSIVTIQQTDKLSQFIKPTVGLNSESILPTVKVKTLAVTIRNNLEEEGTEV